MIDFLWGIWYYVRGAVRHVQVRGHHARRRNHWLRDLRKDVK